MTTKTVKKKKSAREKRVLVGAFIVAAVMIGGSTFAWFTSTDEVTNRLSANAAYDVSIVESFAPPNNWLPGQEVQKDVYATNTGNIGAFVREDITGALTITKEKSTPTLTANSIELSAEERYVMEAGAYLAYKPAGSSKVLGDLIVLRPDDKAGSLLTDFVPDATGLYVFRRSIAVAGDTTETFTYEGYYYASGKYYKISNLIYYADGVTDQAGDDDKSDGTLISASAGFCENEQKVINPVNLEYQLNPEGVSAGQYLIASYDTGNYNAVTQLSTAATAYDEAIHNYEYLTALAEAATGEASAAGDGANGALNVANSELATAQTNLTNALNALQTAQNALNDAQVAYNDALASKNYYQNAVDESKTKLYGKKDGSDQENDYTSESLYGKYKAAQSALGENETQQDSERFESEIDAWFTANKDTQGSEANTLLAAGKESVNSSDLSVAALEEFKTWVVQTANAEEHDFFTKSANLAIARLNYNTENAKLTTENTGYQAMLNAATTTLENATNTLGASTDAASGSGSAWAKYNKAKADYDTAQTAYDTAYKAYLTALEASNAAETTKAEIEAAKQAAADAKTAAGQAYNSALDNGKLSESDGTLKIYIKLSDNVVTAGGTAEKWQMLPNAVANNTATFYYTSILDAGETSTRLIESVQLDKNATKDMYKSFDFDLNIALKSAQITYADDQVTIQAEATPTELNAIATLATPTDINTALTWSKTTPEPAPQPEPDPGP